MPKTLAQNMEREMTFCVIMPKSKSQLLSISIYASFISNWFSFFFQMLLEPNNHVTKRVNTVMGPEFPVTKANLTPTGR